MSAHSILYADDNENDLMLVQMAFRRSAPAVGLKTVNDGQEAVRYLNGDGNYNDRTTFPLPACFLLDLKMPRMTGFEVLQWIRAQEAYKHMPVVVFTSSLEKRDQKRSYSLGANSFLIKPTTIDELVVMVGLLSKYWLEWNQPVHLE
jgi:CheY-like chemotaxis protein